MVAPSAFLSLLIASKTSLALAQKTWPSSLEFLAKGSDEEYKDFVTPLAQMTKCLGMRHGESWGQTAEQGLRSLQTPDDHSFRMFSCSSFFMVLVHAGLKLKQWIATMPAAPKQVASLANLSFPCPPNLLRSTHCRNKADLHSDLGFILPREGRKRDYRRLAARQAAVKPFSGDESAHLFWATQHAREFKCVNWFQSFEAITMIQTRDLTTHRLLFLDVWSLGGIRTVAWWPSVVLISTLPTQVVK